MNKIESYDIRFKLPTALSVYFDCSSSVWALGHVYKHYNLALF